MAGERDMMRSFVLSAAPGRGAARIGAVAVVIALMIASVSSAALPPASSPADDEERAQEVMRSLQQRFWIGHGQYNYYSDKADDTGPSSSWSNGVALSALNAAMRNNPSFYGPLFSAFMKSMDRYWDFKQDLPGYEPFPSDGDGHDKYFDDNEWIAIALLENYAMSGRRPVLERSTQVVTFILSGWDDTLGGGIWWHEHHYHNCKNACSNAPAAVACLRLAQYLPKADALYQQTMAKRIVQWTDEHLQGRDKLFNDNISAVDGKVATFQLTYNSALMIRADLGLWRATGDVDYLTAAKEVSAAADRFVKRDTGGYRDDVRFSHLQVEADLAMYRADGDIHVLERARHAVDADYAAWRKNPSDQLIYIAALARELWLLEESHTYAGRQFWRRVDGIVAEK